MWACGVACCLPAQRAACTSRKPCKICLDCYNMCQSVCMSVRLCRGQKVCVEADEVLELLTVDELQLQQVQVGWGGAGAGAGASACGVGLWVCV